MKLELALISRFRTRDNTSGLNIPSSTTIPNAAIGRTILPPMLLLGSDKTQKPRPPSGRCVSHMSKLGEGYGFPLPPGYSSRPSSSVNSLSASSRIKVQSSHPLDAASRKTSTLVWCLTLTAAAVVASTAPLREVVQSLRVKLCIYVWPVSSASKSFCGKAGRLSNEIDSQTWQSGILAKLRVKVKMLLWKSLIRLCEVGEYIKLREHPAQACITLGATSLS